ncbi:MAG: hypothetical protein ACTSU9_16150, partial [Promethearchaeota archaeon]
RPGNTISNNDDIHDMQVVKSVVINRFFRNWNWNWNWNRKIKKMGKKVMYPNQMFFFPEVFSKNITTLLVVSHVGK